jgi:transposase-like protein
MKNKKNSQYSNQFKLKIALETLREEKTLSQIASEHNILPQNVSNWRKLLLESAEELFGRSHELEYKKRLKKKDDEIEDLHTKIGKLVVEKDWLQKKSKQFGL